MLKHVSHIHNCVKVHSFANNVDCIDLEKNDCIYLNVFELWQI